jgi:hypothetical protein
MSGTAALILELIGILFVIIVGTLLHFTYAASGKNRVVGLFAPVNESTWEHLKMLFFPMLLYSVMEYFAFGKFVDSFIGAKTVGVVAGMFAIIVIFYSYTGILGKNFLFADILTFVIGVLIAFAVGLAIMKNDWSFTAFSIVLLALLVLCFFVSTFWPPKIGLFIDPVTKSYGVPRAEAK